MIIQPYRDSDLAAIAELFTASVHALASTQYDAAQRAAWAPQPPDLSEWRDRLARLQTLVAIEESQLAGFIACERRGHVDLLYTAPTYARRGVASRLYHEAEAAFIAAEVTAVSTEASLVAFPFFKRMGFQVIEEQRVHRRGVAFRRYAMRKPLPHKPCGGGSINRDGNY